MAIWFLGWPRACNVKSSGVGDLADDFSKNIWPFGFWGDVELAM